MPSHPTSASRLGRAIAAISLLCTAACGSPGAYDLCNDSCDAYKRCGYSTDVQATNCHTDCDNNKGKSSDDDAQLAKMCKNAGDIRNLQAKCYVDTSCRGDVVAYTAALVACVADPQVNDCIKP